MDLPTEAELKPRVRAAAAFAGLKQQDLAAKIEVEYDTLRNYFTASRRGPSIDVALRVADACGVPREFMLYGWASFEQPRQPPELEARLAAIEQMLGRLPS